MVLLRAYHGSNQLASELVPTEEIGIRRKMTVRCYSGNIDRFALPLSVVDILSDALENERGHEPLWLQIDRSAGHLAIVPWERLLVRKMPGPILRIPNFFIDPTYLTGRLSLALCVSAPRAKEFYSVYESVYHMVRAVQDSVDQGTDIHVFADNDAYGDLAHAFDDVKDGPHAVQMHDPREAVHFGTGESTMAESKITHSPWLLWMKEKLGSASVDAVHFICPGYFRQGSGALALARSPIDNSDEHWSHFITAGELQAFLDDIGSWALFFSAPESNVWMLGLRLLADKFAWSRPGPVMLHETLNDPGPVGKVYRFLFGEDPFNYPPEGGDVVLYCHPKRLMRKGFEEDAGIEASNLDTLDPGHEWLHATAEKIGRKSRGVQADMSDWERASQRTLETIFFGINDRHGPTARGAADALRFVAELREKYK
jgi:hypothetical protein